jgi:single-stranded-DNA-specific exonuclease
VDGAHPHYVILSPMKKSIVVREPYGETLLDHLLYHRGIVGEEEKEIFLNPEYETGLHDPFLMADMEKAVERIERAISNKEKIVVYSDFDCDGIPGAVTLAHFLKDIGHENVEHYIPHRHDEGFGLHKHALDAIKKSKGDLVITIDCGIADLEEADYAKELGVDLIITDHHQPVQGIQSINSKSNLKQGVGHLKEILPKALAVIDPKRSDCNYPEKMLCGSGVIFKVIQALLKRNRYGLKEGREKWLLDMVGLATLSDMVPLKGENRIFAYYGLKVLQRSPRPGLAHLLSTLKVNQKNLTEDDVQFMITPRINVASRMGNPRDAFILLSTSDFEEADKLVQSLNVLNDERKGSVVSIVKEIKKKMEDRNLLENPVIVLGNPNWRPALLGLVATTLVREYGRPVFLWGRSSGGTLKGSCRSEGFTDILNIMRNVSDKFFIEYGGHTMSGGFSISNENIHRIEEEIINSYVKISEGKVKGAEPLYIDRKMDIDQVNWATWKSIEKLAPFGEGNPKPLFLFENTLLHTIKNFGKAKDHLELVFKNSLGKTVSAISFYGAEACKLKTGDKATFIATMEKSMFRNYPELRLRIVEVL